MDSKSSLYKAIDSLKENISKTPELEFHSIDKSKTVLVIVDMINGFAKSGALYSSNIEKINESIAKLSLRCEANNIPVIAFCDSHDDNSTEFSAFPVHCIRGTEESCLTDEIASSANITLIEKNSTNGYIEQGFQKWLEANCGITDFIIVGCCTDICVLQFALTIKTHFNLINRESRIIVPMSLTATYDSPDHNDELCSLVAFYNMRLNSIEIVSKIV